MTAQPQMHSDRHHAMTFAGLLLWATDSPPPTAAAAAALGRRKQTPFLVRNFSAVRQQASRVPTPTRKRAGGPRRPAAPGRVSPPASPPLYACTYATGAPEWAPQGGVASARPQLGRGPSRPRRPPYSTPAAPAAPGSTPGLPH